MRIPLAAASCQGFDDKVEVVTEFRVLALCGCSKPAQTFAQSLAVSLITQRFRFLSVTNLSSLRFYGADKGTLRIDPRSLAVLPSPGKY
jgi:hypothetical protein